MFRVDKDTLKKLMTKKIEDYYIQQPYVNENFYVDPGLEQLKQAIVYAHKESIRQSNEHLEKVIKPFVEDMIHSLIDELYTQREFNEDLGLYK